MASLVISWAVILLWILVVSPLLCKLFRAPLPLSFRDRRIAIRKWSFKRYLWLWGVLTFGVAMFLGTGMFDYVAWRHWPYPWQRPSIGGRVLLHAAEWLAFGLLWGWLTWDEQRHLEAQR
jgi:hypothetical protein